MSAPADAEHRALGGGRSRRRGAESEQADRRIG